MKSKEKKEKTTAKTNDFLQAHFVSFKSIILNS